MLLDAADPLSMEQAGAAGTPAAPDRKPAFIVTPSVSLEETFTDNARLLKTGGQSDWISTVSGGVDVSGKTERTQIAGSYTVSGDFYAKDSGLDGYRQDLLTVDRIEPVQPNFSIDLRAAVDQEQIAQTGAQSATVRSGISNQTQVANVSVTPAYVEHWGQWGISTLSYTFNRVAYFDTSTSNSSGSTGSTGLNDSTQQRLAATLASGSAFSRLTWNLALSDDISRSSSFHFDEQAAEADAEYRIISAVRVPVTVGYDNFSLDDLTTGSTGLSASSLSGLFWNTGLHLVPGPRTDLTLRYGHRYGKPYESGALTYRIFSDLRFTAGYDVTTETQQETLAKSLQGVTVDSSGNIVNSLTGLTANPNQLSASLVNSVYRARTFFFGVGGTHGLNFFSLTGRSTLRFYGGAQADDRSEVVDLTLGRNLSPVTTASFTVEAGRAVTSATSTATTASSSANFLSSLDVTRRLSNNTTLGFEVARRQQTGSGGADEDVVVVRISHKF